MRTKTSRGGFGIDSAPSSARTASSATSITFSAGRKWKPTLEAAVRGSDVVLALIGKQWLTCTDPQTGQRRLHAGEDWVRFELEIAKASDRTVIPILVKGAPVPKPEELPTSIRWLCDIHVTEMRGGGFFDDDVARLIRELRKIDDGLKKQAEYERRAQGGATGGGDASGGALKCPGCTKFCSRADKFCDHCGAALWEPCPRCDKQTPIGQRFCTSCGSDVPKAKLADGATASARARLLGLSGITDAAKRLEAADAAMRELDEAIRQSPGHAPLLDSRGPLVEVMQAAARQSADESHTAGRFSRALELFGRLAKEGDSEAQKRVEAIQQDAAYRLNEAAALVAAGRHRRALPIYSVLEANFPDDQNVARLHADCRKVYDRAEHLVTKRVRELWDQHLLIELRAELDWLESQHIRNKTLESITADVRETLSWADSTVELAWKTLREGNLPSAIRKARRVLEAVADHEGAMKVTQQSDTVAELVSGIVSGLAVIIHLAGRLWRKRGRAAATEAAAAEELAAEAEAPPPTRTTPPAGDVKTCPACGKEIKAISLRCRWCETDFDTADPMTAEEWQSRGKSKRSARDLRIGVIMLFVMSLLGVLAPLMLPLSAVYVYAMRRDLRQASATTRMLAYATMAVSALYLIGLLIWILMLD